MPGIIPHLLAASALFVIGSLYYGRRFEEGHKTREYGFLLLACFAGSFFPDVILGSYYLFHIFTYDLLEPYHFYFTLLLGPVSLGLLVVIILFGHCKRKHLWIMGVGAVLLHVFMDFTIQEQGLWI